MNNEEQDVKKKIMMVVGACIFLIATALTKRQQVDYNLVRSWF